MLLGQVVGFSSLFPDEQAKVRARVRALVRRAAEEHGTARASASFTRDGFALIDFDFPEDLLDTALGLQELAVGEPFSLRLALGTGLLSAGALGSGLSGDHGVPQGEVADELRALLELGESGHVLASGAFRDVLGARRRVGDVLETVGVLRHAGRRVEVLVARTRSAGNPEPPRGIVTTTMVIGVGGLSGVQAPQLVLVGGARCGEALALQPGVTVIGRDPLSCTHVLSDGSVSRRHCQLEASGGEIVVTDLGSSNGTFLDGRRLPANVAVRWGADEPLVVGRQQCALLPADAGEPAREALLRDALLLDPRTGFLRYPVFVERLAVELLRSRASGQGVLIAAFESRLSRELSQEYGGSLQLGPFWRRALAPVRAVTTPWDMFGASASLRLVYAVFPARPDVAATRAEIERLVGVVNASEVDTGSGPRSPKVAVAVIDASVHSLMTADLALHRVRYALARR